MTGKAFVTTIVVALGLFAMGYFWGLQQGKPKQQRPAPVAYEPGEADQKLESLKSKFVKLSEEDYAEYLQIKDQRARYQKADEILGKIILLFLADLGVRVSQDQMKFAKEGSAPLGAVEPNSRPLKNRQDGRRRKKAATASEGSVAKPQPNLPSKGLDKILASEKKLENVYSDEEVEEILKQVTLDNFFDHLRSSANMSVSQVERLSGMFAGKVHFDDSSKTSWDAKIIFSGRLEQGGLKGSAKVELSKDGKTFSNSRSKGNLGKNFKSLPGGSQGIIVEANGGDGYFQLYAPPRLNSLVGLYYHRQRIGEFKRTAVVTLFRQ